MADAKVEEGKESPSQASRRAGRRSPNFPYIGLPTAIQRITQLYSHEHRNAAPLAVVAQHWDYSPTSSSTDKVLGALNSYGLIETQTVGEDRMIRLTDRALDIVEDEREDSPDRDAAIRAAALNPPIFADIRSEYGSVLPSDASLRTWLVRQRNYSQGAADSIIANYRATIGYAQLDSPANASNNRSSTPKNESEPKPIEVGLYVQWTSSGSAQFPKPKRVLGLSEDGQFAFVQDVQTGLPVNQLTVEQPPATDLGATPPLSPFSKAPIVDPAPAAGTKRDVYGLREGDLVLDWPESLSQESYDEAVDWLELLKRKLKRAVPDKPKGEK